MERTGRTANVLKDFDSGTSGVTQNALNAVANLTVGTVVDGAGGEVLGAMAGAVAVAGLKSAVAKISSIRSGGMRSKRQLMKLPKRHGPDMARRQEKLQNGASWQTGKQWQQPGTQ